MSDNLKKIMSIRNDSIIAAAQKYVNNKLSQKQRLTLDEVEDVAKISKAIQNNNMPFLEDLYDKDFI